MGDHRARVRGGIHAAHRLREMRRIGPLHGTEHRTLKTPAERRPASGVECDRHSLAAGSTEPSSSIDPTRSKTSTVSATRDGNSCPSQSPTRISSGRPLVDHRVELSRVPSPTRRGTARAAARLAHQSALRRAFADSSSIRARIARARPACGRQIPSPRFSSTSTRRSAIRARTPATRSTPSTPSPAAIGLPESAPLPLKERPGDACGGVNSPQQDPPHSLESGHDR